MTTVADTMKVRLGPLTVLDEAGKVITPSPIDGIPVWSSDNEDAFTVVADADGMNAWAISNNPVDGSSEHSGFAKITATADCQPGSGVSNFSGFTELVCVNSGAASVGMGVGTPELK